LIDEITQNKARGGKFVYNSNACVVEFQSQMHPIIIVPTTLTPGSLCLGNAYKFLEKGTYEESGVEVPQPVQIKHKINGREITFDVYDSTTGFSESKWRRLVCVICSGNDWQFKGWKPLQGSGSELSKKELFARVRGYYMTYSDSKIPPVIETWNVVKLILPRNKRHHDVNEMTKFWQDFEIFLKREKFRGSDW